MAAVPVCHHADRNGKRTHAEAAFASPLRVTPPLSIRSSRNPPSDLPSIHTRDTCVRRGRCALGHLHSQQ